MASTYWDQSRFDATFKRLLERLPREKIPNAINKKTYFLARRAVALTPRKERFQIAKELATVVIATRKDGSTAPVPVGWVVIAKRAAKGWAWARMERGLKNVRQKTASRAWLQRLKKLWKGMFGGRTAAAGFMALGWQWCVMALAPHIKNKSGAPYMPQRMQIRGRPKGKITLATWWRHGASIENLAQARSEKRAGLIRMGGPALDRAFAEETADMERFLQEEVLKEEIARVNREMR